MFAISEFNLLSKREKEHQKKAEVRKTGKQKEKKKVMNKTVFKDIVLINLSSCSFILI